MVERQNNTRSVLLGNLLHRQAIKNGICLVSRGGGWSSSDYGYIKFTSGSNSVEFPAVGWRDDSTSGTLRETGTDGYYWSAFALTYYGVSDLCFNSSGLYVGGGDKADGHSVRCVR